MTNIKKLQAVYDIITNDELSADAMIAEIGNMFDERPTGIDFSFADGKPTNGNDIHIALMHGLEESGIKYDSDGETYWVDCQDGDTRYVTIDVCADKSI